MTLAAFAGVFMAYNYARFGTLLDSLPMRFHVQYNASRLENIRARSLHPEQALPIFFNYLVHTPQFRASYPWLTYRGGSATDLGSLDLFELHTGALPTMPALALLAWAGWHSLKGRRERRMLLAPVIGVVALASVAAVSHRYMHEFVLLLAPAAAFGLRWAWSTNRRLAVTIALTFFSVYANWAIALVGQREIHPWTSEVALDNHRATRFRIDRWLGLSGPVRMPLEYDYTNGSRPPRVKGVEVRFIRTGSRYLFDGQRWQYRSGPRMHRYTVRLRTEDLPTETKFTLFTVGASTNAELIHMERIDPERYRLCIEHWGSSMAACSREFNLIRGREQEFVIDMDRLNNHTNVSLNGVVDVATREDGFHLWASDHVSATPTGSHFNRRNPIR